MISVLYVDDEPDLLSLTSTFLLRLGDFSIETATSACGGLGRMAERGFDVVVSDYQMAGMDGIEFLKEVRTRFPDCPFILFTGKGREEVVIEAINNGVDFYLQKGGDPRSQFAELAHKIQIAAERRRVKEALRRSEEKYRELVENASTIILKMDRAGNIIFINRFAQEFFGFSPGEILGKPVVGTIVPQTESGSDRDLRTLLEDIIRHPENHVNNVNENITRDKRRVWVQWWNNPLFDEKGQFEGLLSVGIDITEQLRLAEIRERHKVFIDHARDIILFIRRSDGKILECNDAAIRAYGYSREDLLGLTVFDIRSSEDKRIIRDQMAKAANESVIFETVHKRKDGTVFPAEVSSVPHTLDGTPVLASIIRDISERKKAELAIRKSEEMFRILFESAQDGILIIRDGKLIRGNKKALEMYGCKQEDDFRGKNPWEFSPPFQPDGSDSRAVAEKRLQAACEGMPQFFEWEHLRADGTRFFVEVTLSRLFTEGHTVLVAIARDISGRKKVEESLRQANQKLSLLSSITRHDILNQIAALEGLIALAEEKQGSSSEPSRFIEREKVIAKNLHRQILFTKDYEELGIQSPRWQNLKECIEPASSLVPPGISLDIRTQDFEILADPLLEKVCYNLIDNSVRHGGRGIDRISVIAQPENNHLRILFEDNGAGISGSDKTRLFERGFGKNTGLGLFLSREILALTGISIRETGIPGRGARFEIDVPRDAFRARVPGPDPGVCHE